MSAAADYLNSVLKADPDSRPVLCDGKLDQRTDVMLLGHNPGLASPALDSRFWDGESCNRQAWLAAWAWGPARIRMESELIPALHGLRIIECNLSHYPSKSYLDLPRAKRKTEVFEVLVELLAPKLIVTFGKHAREHFDRVRPKGEFVKRTIRNVTLDIFLGDHLIMGGCPFGKGIALSSLASKRGEYAPNSNEERRSLCQYRINETRHASGRLREENGTGPIVDELTARISGSTTSGERNRKPRGGRADPFSN